MNNHAKKFILIKIIIYPFYEIEKNIMSATK